MSHILGLQVAFQRNCFNGLECAKLLLSMWKRSCHSRVRWTFTKGLYYLWSSSSRIERNSLQETSSRLFPLKNFPKTLKGFVKKIGMMKYRIQIRNKSYGIMLNHPKSHIPVCRTDTVSGILEVLHFYY